MDFQDAQNNVVTSVASAGLSPGCVGPTMESAQYAFHVASEYGLKSPEAANVTEYANTIIPDSCARVEIQPALDLVDQAFEAGSAFN